MKYSFRHYQRTVVALLAAVLSASGAHACAIVDDSDNQRSVSTATYRLTFESTWSAATHPTDFPPNPHFSGLIGGTHNESVVFWLAGAVASNGIESMAETGSKTLLEGEVSDAITAGSAEFIVSGGGISSSPGSVSVDFDVTADFPLVTVVSMVAPSPDWFVGVSGLDLRDGTEWMQQVVVPMVVHDAGTDNGPSYTSANDDANPRGTIAALTDVPFNDNNVMGTFTFTLQSVVANESVPGDMNFFDVSPVFPNPATDIARVAVRVGRSQAVRATLFDVAGRRVKEFDAGYLSGGGFADLVIDLHGLAGQFYFLRVSGAAAVVTRPVVVRR